MNNDIELLTIEKSSIRVYARIYNPSAFRVMLHFKTWDYPKLGYIDILHMLYYTSSSTCISIRSPDLLYNVADASSKYL